MQATIKSVIGKPKTSLDTPCLVIDRNLLLENISNMQREVNVAEKKLRPHVKTHKCLEICKLQISAGAVGIAAAKVSEALILAEAGFKNTLITSPVISSQKIENLMRCLQNDAELTVVIDNIENATAIHTAAKSYNKKINVLIDIDPGLGRTGIAPQELMIFAQALKKLDHLNLHGIQYYAGNLQHIADYQQRCAASTEKMQQAAKALKQLRAAGFYCAILSGSGTGTYNIDLQIPEVTEVQPGSYTVMDAEYQTIGSAENPQHYKKFKPALTLLTTIVSANQKTHVTCDAGWKALYEVPTKPIVLKPAGYQYADWFGDEHGKITALKHFKLPKLGERLELMVAHCDPTINLFDVFYIIENGFVVDVWPIDMRGKSQ
jgi:D-serine deaminase-like pyridoxal phosphate-dependent protein